MKGNMKRVCAFVLALLLTVNFMFIESCAFEMEAEENEECTIFVADDMTSEVLSNEDPGEAPVEAAAELQEDILEEQEAQTGEEIIDEEEIKETENDSNSEVPSVVDVDWESEEETDGLELQEDGFIQSVEILPEEPVISEEVKAAAADDTGEVTRAEWISKLVKTFDMTVTDDNYPDNYFSDVEDSSAYYYDILLAAEFGVLDIEAGEAFKPDDPATREFAAHTLNYCLGFELEEEKGYTFSDVGEASYPVDAQIALDRSWFDLVDGKFAPTIPITSAEMQKMLEDAKNVQKSIEFDKNHENVIEFAEDVVVIPKGTALLVDDNGVILVSNCPVEVHKGDKIAVYIGDLPQIFMVTAVEQRGNQLLISTNEADANEAMTNMDIEGTERGDLSQAVPLDDTTVTYITGGTEEKAFEDGQEYASPALAGSKEIRALRMVKSVKLGNGVKITLTATLSDLYADYNIQTSLTNNDIYVGIHGVSTITGNAEIDVAAAAGAPASVQLAYIPITYIGGITVTADISLQGQVSLSYVGNFKTGIQYTTRNGFRLVREFSKENFTIAAEITGEIGLTAAAAINKLPVISGRIYAKMGVETEMTMDTYDDGEKPKCCIHLSSWMFASAGASVTIDIGIKKWPFKKDISIYTENNSPVRVVFHYEDGRQVMICTRNPHKYYTPANSRYGSSGMREGWSTGLAGETILPTYEYELDEEKNATITKYNGNVSALIIPSTLDGYKVTEIGSNVFKNDINLYSVIIPNTVIKIGGSAFKNCTNLENVTLSSNLKIMDEAVFGNCTSLREIEIPKSLEKAYDIAVLVSGYGTFSGSGLQNVSFEQGVTRIAAGLFWECKELEQVTIPDTVTEIQKMAFRDCTALQTVTIPDNVVSLGETAFKNCTNLEHVTLSKNLRTMDTAVFGNCTSLREIEIPKSLEKAYDIAVLVSGYGTFSGSGLQNVSFEQGVTRIAAGLFWECKELEQITIPDTVTEIQKMAFRDCTALRTVTIPDNVVSLGETAFKNCTNLEHVTLSKNLRTMDAAVFGNCTSLREIEIPKSLEKAYDIPVLVSDYGTFSGSGLQNVSFEQGVTRIAAGLFRGCKELEQITIPDTVMEIQKMAFQECASLRAITIPKNVTSIKENAFKDCTNLETVTLLAQCEGIEGSTFQNCEKLASIELPQTVTYIEGSAFRNSGLTEISLSGAVTRIEDSAFSETPLKKITFENGLQTIGNNAFYKCVYLEEVNFPDTVRQLGTHVFESCEALSDVKLGTGITVLPSYIFYQCQNLKKIILPYRMTKVNDHAFTNCTSFTEVTIPRSVTSISDDAFSYPGKMTIYGISGTYAEEYAKEKGISFVNQQVSAEKVVLNKTKLVMDKRTKEVLAVSVQPLDFTDEVVWTSSDEKIASVADDGTVTAKDTESTVIQVKAGKVSAACSVTVVQPGQSTQPEGPDQTEKPEEPGQTEKPEEPSQTEKPEEPGQTEKPEEPGQTEKPNEPGQTEKPNEPGQTEKPDESSQTEKPDKPNQPSKKQVQKIEGKNSFTKTYGDGKFSLGVKLTGDGHLSYASSSKAVVEVNAQGKVTIRGCGKATITITAAETVNYEKAVKKVSIKIVPKKMSITTLKSSKKKKITVKWKRDTKVTGYEIQYSFNAKFKSAKKINIAKNKTVFKTFSVSKSKKICYVRIRGYKKVGNLKLYGKWSKTKKLKVK